MKKVLWADMTDDDPIELEVSVSISKHGIKVKKTAATSDDWRKDKSVDLVKDK